MFILNIIEVTLSRRKKAPSAALETQKQLYYNSDEKFRKENDYEIQR